MVPFHFKRYKSVKQAKIWHTAAIEAGGKAYIENAQCWMGRISSVTKPYFGSTVTVCGCWLPLHFPDGLSKFHQA